MHKKLILCSLLATLALTACGKKETPKPADSGPAASAFPARDAKSENWEPYNCGKDMICSVQVNPQTHSAIIKADVSNMILKEKPAMAEQLKTHKFELKTTLAFDCVKKMGRLASISETKISRSNPNETEVVMPETAPKTEDWAKMSPDRDDWAVYNKACQQ